jgi:hypothetical protein
MANASRTRGIVGETVSKGGGDVRTSHRTKQEAILAFVEDLAELYADLWLAGRLDEIREQRTEDE